MGLPILIDILFLFNINILSSNIISIYYKTKLINKRNDIIILFY